MAFQDYGILKVSLNGNSLTQLSKIGIKFDSGQQPIDVLNEGLSGFTPGSGRVTIDLGILLPIGGFEEDYFGKLADGEFVTMQLFAGPVSYVGKGKLTEGGIDQSVNGAVEATATWIGQLRKLQ